MEAFSLILKILNNSWLNKKNQDQFQNPQDELIL